MKTIKLLLLLFCTHAALAVTAPCCREIDGMIFPARTPYTRNIEIRKKTHAHFLKLPEMCTERTYLTSQSNNRSFFCDLSPTEKDEGWSPHSAGDVLVRMVTTVPSDLISITTYPVENLNETKIFVGITTALLITDRKTTWFIQNNVDPALEFNYSRLFDSSFLTAADSYIIVGLGALYAGSLAVGSEKGQAAALLSYKSIAYSVLFTHLILKTVTARKRPFDPLEGSEEVEEPYTRNQFDFFNFHRPYVKANINATSFPSFRFTMCFATARVLQKVYNNAVIPYSICALALLPGFGGHDHWVSDMAAGAMVGIAIGNVVTGNFFQENYSKTSMAPQKKQYYSVSLIPERSRCSLALKYHF